MLDTARTRLAALRENTPRTKAARVRALWPEIKAALEKGHTLKAVCDCLEADGIAITVQTLGSYLTRIRRNSLRPDSVVASNDRQCANKPLENEKSSPTLNIKRDRQNSGDPLSNVRDRLGKRT